MQTVLVRSSLVRGGSGEYLSVGTKGTEPTPTYAGLAFAKVDQSSSAKLIEGLAGLNSSLDLLLRFVSGRDMSPTNCHHNNNGSDLFWIM